jgi:hypothetical protein
MIDRPKRSGHTRRGDRVQIAGGDSGRDRADT